MYQHSHSTRSSSEGRLASSSGRTPGQQVRGAHSQQQGAPVNLAVGQKEGLPLSLYFAQRKLLVNSNDGFRIFCSALALVQVHFCLQPKATLPHSAFVGCRVQHIVDKNLSFAMSPSLTRAARIHSLSHLWKLSLEAVLVNCQ